VSAACAPWCLTGHDDQDTCEGIAFETTAISAPAGLVVGIREGESGQAVVFVEEVGATTGVHMPVMELSGEQLVMMRDALMELSCRAGVCDCGHGPLCRHPDCIGDCENSPKCQGLKATTS
jgi:hypothetical protein